MEAGYSSPYWSHAFIRQHAHRKGVDRTLHVPGRLNAGLQPKIVGNLSSRCWPAAKELICDELTHELQHCQPRCERAAGCGHPWSSWGPCGVCVRGSRLWAAQEGAGPPGVRPLPGLPHHPALLRGRPVVRAHRARLRVRGAGAPPPPPPPTSRTSAEPARPPARVVSLPGRLPWYCLWNRLTARCAHVMRMLTLQPVKAVDRKRSAAEHAGSANVQMYWNCS